MPRRQVERMDGGKWRFKPSRKKRKRIGKVKEAAKMKKLAA